MFTKQDIDLYFNAFKNGQLILSIIGIVALAAAVVFYFILKKEWYKGFALPLAVFAFLLAGAGFSNYKKSDQLRIRSIYNYDLHPELLKSKELPRIREQKQNLSVLIYINLSIIVASFLIFLYFRKKYTNEYYMGAAASLFLMAGISIAIYAIMISYLRPYENGIEAYTKNIIVREK